MNSPYFVGQVVPPTDMVGAARDSLSREGFDELMRETDGAAPTPSRLVELVEAERAAGKATQWHSGLQSDSETTG